MDEVKAIPLQGINHHVDKINVVDGMCEDIVNIRYKDGSWRTTGEGTIINADNAIEYKQVFIHTNVYRHVLGVKDNQLWWFGNLVPKADDAAVEKELFEFKPLTPAVAITSVQGDLFVSQTGHLLTVIDHPEKTQNEDGTTDTFDHFVFKTSTKEYKKVVVDENGRKADRKLYPFGGIHFNFYSPIDDQHKHRKQISSAISPLLSVAHADMLEMFKKAAEHNQFTRPFLVLGAYELYDGSYIYASNPTYMFPRELSALGKGLYKEIYSMTPDATTTLLSSSQERVNNDYSKNDDVAYNPRAQFPVEFIPTQTRVGSDGKERPVFNNGSVFRNTFYAKPVCVRRGGEDSFAVPQESIPTFSSGGHYAVISSSSYPYETQVLGSDLCVSLEDKDFLKNNDDIIRAFCIFVTREADYYDMSEEAYKESVDYVNKDSTVFHVGRSFVFYSTAIGATDSVMGELSSYFPKRNSIEKIAYDLTHSPFYLLREFTKLDIDELSKDGVVKLDSPEYEKMLLEIDYGISDVEMTVLESASISRASYLPKVVANYNGRLHFANYKAIQFHGYPIDQFNTNNHSIRYSIGSYFDKKLKDYISNGDSKSQWERGNVQFITDNDLISKKAPVAIIRTEIDASDGTQVVVRYIEAKDFTTMVDGGEANFLEDLDPLLTFPDYRAKKMDIYLTVPAGVYAQGDSKYMLRHKEFELKPHPYLNLAYYMEPNLRPIKWSDFETLGYKQLEVIT